MKLDTDVCCWYCVQTYEHGTRTSSSMLPRVSPRYSLETKLTGTRSE